VLNPNLEEILIIEMANQEGDNEDPEQHLSQLPFQRGLGMI